MFKDINKKLRDVREKLRYKKKWEQHLTELQLIYDQRMVEVKQLKYQWLKEKRDVEKLESISLSNFFYTITGRKLEKLDQEQQEEIKAKFKYEAKTREIEELKKEMEEYKEKLQSVSFIEEEYENLLKEKEQKLYMYNPKWSEELDRLYNEETELLIQIKEFDEAIGVGNKVKKLIEKARAKLESTSSWSTLDMFGGGLITTSIKHGKIDDARSIIQQLQHALDQFKVELNDIKIYMDNPLEIGSFLTFADYFFDNIFVDWSIHNKINKTIDNINKTSYKVTNVLNDINWQKQELDKRLLNLRNQREQIIQTAGENE